MLAIAVLVLADAALNPEVTQATINETICRGATAKLKLQFLKSHGDTWVSAPKYQVDHIIPLCLGGSPTDPVADFDDDQYRYI